MFVAFRLKNYKTNFDKNFRLFLDILRKLRE